MKNMSFIDKMHFNSIVFKLLVELRTVNFPLSFEDLVIFDTKTLIADVADFNFRNTSL